MKELIKNIFLEHEFNVHETEFGSLFVKIDETIKYYWLVIEVEQLDAVLENQDEWFNKSKTIIEDQNFDKNTSLLILTKKEDSDSQKILSIEEDPFQFRKLVLTYTDEALEELKNESENGIKGKIQKLVVNGEVFEHYKNNYEDYSWRHLLYRLASKLPFLQIEIDSNQNLDNLFEKGDEELDRKGLLAYSQDIATKFSNDIMNNLLNMSADNLIELFNEQTENGN